MSASTPFANGYLTMAVWVTNRGSPGLIIYSVVRIQRRKTIMPYLDDSDKIQSGSV